MKEILEKQFFPYVIKPGRYAGGELGQIIKSPEGRTTYLHAFPDKYELGQSYLGLQILYHVINSDDRFLCERVFAVDNDAEEVLRRSGLELFSLESNRSAGEFDAIGFTLTYELVYTNMLAMLDLAGIPLMSKDRGDEHPFVLAGGPAVYNPEPLADFVDVFFIGDAEQGLPEVLGVLHEMKSAGRGEKLVEICRKVPSTYIPALYSDDRKPLHEFVPEEIKARVEKDLRPDFYPKAPLVPLIDTVHSHLGVEIMRGCPQGCRYCQAGPMYRPVRQRPVADIIAQTESQLKNSGYDEISLVSLSSSDYSEIENLALSLARRLDKQRVSISLPSLRPGTITPELLDAIRRIRKAGLTISPEAGTERLRQFIRKEITDTAVLNTARLAFERGWTTIKLYFMIGLPTETEEDLLGIVSLVKKIYDIGFEYPGKKTINVTLSPFVPKALTPFQWDEMAEPEEILRKVKFIKRHNRVNHVNFKYPRVESSFLQGLLGRGDRRVGRAILAAYNKGCRFDGWSENFVYERWLEAFSENSINPEQLRQPIPFDKQLPWSNIKKGTSAEHLQKERQRTSFEQMESREVLRTPELEPSAQTEAAYGRAKKKVASRNGTAPTKNTVRIRWGKDSRFKYLSHLDNIRTIERAIRRSRIPVSYSQGFNPTMKLSFGPPLPLGFTSEAEFMDITLESNLLPYMVENVVESLPEGISLFEARAVIGKVKSLSASLNRASYCLPVNNIPIDIDLERSIVRLLDAANLVVERTGKTETRTVDIRPAVYSLSVKEGALWMTLGIGEGGYARPAEVLKLMLEGAGQEYLMFQLHRHNLYRVDQNGEQLTAMDV